MDTKASEHQSSASITDKDTAESTSKHVGDDNAAEEEAKEQVAPISKLLGLAKPEWPMLFVALLLMVVSEAGGLVNPLLVAEAYDYLVDPELTQDERISKISRSMSLVLVIHFSAVLMGFLRGSIMGVAGERVVARTRNNLYGSILSQEIPFFDKTKTGELVSRLGSDTALLQQGTSQALPEVIIGIIKVLVAIGLMFWISAKLAGLMVGIAFMLMVVCVPFGRRLGTLSKAYQDVLGEAQTHSTEALGAMRTVQSFAAEKRERERYRYVIGDPAMFRYWFPTDRKTHRTTYSVGFFKAIVMVGFYTLIFGVGFGSMYGSLWYGFKLVNDGELTLGELTAFQSYIFTIGGGLGHTSQFISKLIEAQGAAARVFFLLERTPKIPTPWPSSGKRDDENPAPPRKPDHMEGAVDFNEVYFAYPTRSNIEVLRNFSLSIPPNQVCAVVGSSGAGKSTVISLLQRFYDVTGGSITIDGHDIRDLDLSFLRSQIGFVQQEPQLFGLTVRANITYGMEDREVTQEEIESVAKEANAHDFVCEFPDGYDTLVGERGIQLSGGQKQRICIARALLVNPRILLLDEATSALDSESEHLVQEAINKAVVGRTVLIVAHRLSTIQRAEQIVVIDNHQIVDTGSHEALLERCGKYQDLIKRQSLIGNLPSKVTAEDLSKEN